MNRTTMNPTLATRQQGDLEIYLIENPFCKAEFTLFGGHVMQWQPKGEKPVFWTSENAAMDGKKAIRGGIPICWPWFGEIEERGKHGLARTRFWQLEAVQESEQGTEVILSIELQDADNPWAYPATCKQRLVFGETLLQELSVTNTSNTDSEFAFALHSYFLVSSPNNIDIPFTEGLPYYDKILDADFEASGKQPDFSQPVDRVYYGDSPVSFTDTAWKRKIYVDRQECPDTVVWNPGVDAKDISDIHPGGEKDYLCVESAASKAVKIAANTTATVAQTIRIEAV